MAAHLPIGEAAPALGVSVSAIRRGLKSGRYRGRRGHRRRVGGQTIPLGRRAFNARR
jgi:hypothetical protein